MRKYFKIIVILTGLLIFFPNVVSAQSKVKVGMYITSIYDLNFSEESFKVDFWMWALYDQEDLRVLDSIEVANAKETAAELKTVETKGGLFWANQKYRAVIKKPWDVRNFPFDKQMLEIVLEDSFYETSDLLYEADVDNTKVDPSVSMSGWTIKNIKFEAKNLEYNTTYGNPELKGKSLYPAVVFTADIVRTDWILFLKLFSGVYVALVISLLVFFIDPVDVDPRFGLSVGALFASVANKYMVDSLLPQTAFYTLVDKIHNVTFVYLMINIGLSIWSLALYKKDKIPLSKKLDHWSFILLLGSYMAINFVFISAAL